jgi:hypothetical protein
MTPRRDVQTLALDEPLPRVQGWWLCFSPDTSAEAARRRFRQKYGCEPAEVLRAGAVLLVGPLPGCKVRTALEI